MQAISACRWTISQGLASRTRAGAQNGRTTTKTIEDARLLDKAPRAHLELIKGMNHILKDAPLDRAVNFATYANPDLPIARGLIREIEDFIEDDD